LKKVRRLYILLREIHGYHVLYRQIGNVTVPCWICKTGLTWNIKPVSHNKIVCLTKILDFVQHFETEEVYMIVIQEVFQGRSWKVIWRRNLIDDACMLITELKCNRRVEVGIINELVPNHVHRYP
jgi:hypothetical protein